MGEDANNVASEDASHAPSYIILRSKMAYKGKLASSERLLQKFGVDGGHKILKNIRYYKNKQKKWHIAIDSRRL